MVPTVPETLSSSSRTSQQLSTTSALFRVPKAIEFKKLSSSKSYRVPKTLKFQKLSSSKNSQVPNTSEFHRTEFHHSELQFHITSEFQRTEFHHSELQFHITSEFQRTEFHHSELQFQLLLCFIEPSSILQNSSSKILLSYTHLWGSTRIQVPRNSTEFRHLITE